MVVQTTACAYVVALATVARSVGVVPSAADVFGDVGVLGDRRGRDDDTGSGIDDALDGGGDGSDNEDADVERVGDDAFAEETEFRGLRRKGDFSTDRLVVEKDVAQTEVDP
jgi:hypothetical protein